MDNLEFMSRKRGHISADIIFRCRHLFHCVPRGKKHLRKYLLLGQLGVGDSKCLTYFIREHLKIFRGLD